MTLVVLAGCTLSLFPVSQSHAQTHNSEVSWPFGKDCKKSEAGKTRKSKTEVCSLSGNKYSWVKTIRTSQVDALAPICLSAVKHDNSGEICGWVEGWGLEFVKKGSPGETCVRLLRELIYKVSVRYDPQGIGKWLSSERAKRRCG